MRGQLGASRGSLNDALLLAESLPELMRDVVEQEMTRISDPDLQIPILQPLLRHLNQVLDFVEKHLAHGTRRELSEALGDEVRQELADLGVADHQVVLSHGAANNFDTTYGDLSKVFFGPVALDPSQIPAVSKFALFRVPRLEGASVQWRPVVLGHEAAHVAVTDKDAVKAFDIPSKFDYAAAGALPNPAAGPNNLPLLIALGLFKIATFWATELICDLEALHRFGPAAVASLAEFLEVIGAMEVLMPTHPPGLLRIRLLLDQIGSVSDARLNSIVAPWADRIPPNISFTEGWAQYLVDFFILHRASLNAAVSVLATEAYEFEDRSEWVHAIADRLAVGLPGRESLSDAGTTEVSENADVVNAAWLARVEGAMTPFDQLAEKTLESVQFVRKWLASGGQIPSEIQELRTDADEVLAAEAGLSVLSEDCLLRRMQLDDQAKGLVVAPALDLPKGTGIDLRLGTRFIVFRRTATASFDPLAEEDDPRAIQMFVELSHRERFVLHPQEVILGATLEYLGIPDDLSGQVITRSSYGRLGLLSATAVQVHPGFRGCLTLELVNLSTIPITLTPGERIAQLILWKTGPVQPSTDKYTYPIGPQFSRVRADSESSILRKLRS
ncbi:dCTP deaminase [Mycobacterium paragordonae]|uniref:dCTP deaminase n=1 Tax=Mycobacterium paragordonae TaxID=1389713 RepID=A0ABQ1CCS7_9MYCO|nr:dCTP deaminase [Mycobacterium paragordonae]GFG82311.1 dCTP deaminase [Mycobacterium paragordonae]